MKACELTSLHDRRVLTIDQSFYNIWSRHQRKEINYGKSIVKEKLVDPYIVTIDSTLLKAKGHLWHKSSMFKGLVSRSGIDTDAI
jgi:hypothetical protein